MFVAYTRFILIASRRIFSSSYFLFFSLLFIVYSHCMWKYASQCLCLEVRKCEQEEEEMMGKLLCLFVKEKFIFVEWFASHIRRGVKTNIHTDEHTSDTKEIKTKVFSLFAFHVSITTLFYVSMINCCTQQRTHTRRGMCTFLH